MSTSQTQAETPVVADLTSETKNLSISDSKSEEKSPQPAAPPPTTAAPTPAPQSSETHPLQNSWSLFYDNPGKRVSQSSWADSLRVLSTCTVVEDFWRVHNNVVPPSKLASGSNYHLFKTGIEPMWEDPANKQGGKWIVTVPKAQKAMVDDLWLNLILMMIGEMCEYADEICGAVVSMRKAQDRLCLWTRTARLETVQLSIGRAMRETLALPAAWPLGYQAHADSQKHNSSFNSKNRYEC
eukprot:gnl/Hemi2/8251_TR2845_c0_g6_i1.p1 gnl/Hemi2/8251_TR2845_c0_g6~~gnl/Hemi2/8251_TR2845_c0_g6_i1.p1  ORF type:complete len:240 (-),score=66.57 gnl/Hemi2/8251_TR2845_c0_g6_i1:224-943(-)